MGCCIMVSFILSNRPDDNASQPWVREGENQEVGLGAVSRSGSAPLFQFVGLAVSSDELLTLDPPGGPGTPQVRATAGLAAAGG
jgi:hypothetical protein